MRILFILLFLTLIGIIMLTGGLFFAAKWHGNRKTAGISLIVAIAGSVILLLLRLIKWVFELRIRF